MAMSDVRAQETAAPRRWLAIVGIGENGVEGLSPVARKLVGSADIVFGGSRHLRLARALVRGELRPWPRPFAGAVGEVLAHRSHQVCVLASGDPFVFGVGAVIAKHVAAEEMIVVPAPSAFSLAAARLGWSLPHTRLVSLHARSLELIRPHLHPRARVLALTSDAEAPGALARLLTDADFGRSRMTVLEALGGPRERVRQTTAEGFDLEPVDALNTVALEIVAGPNARIIARAPGLPDACFEHDGALTKREIRALTLGALAPRYGELLWDVGAGAGSVAIEWMLCDASLRAIAIERRSERAARIRRNAIALGVPALTVVEADAPQAFEGLPVPAAIFVGGGASTPGVLERLIQVLDRGGRLIANAVTLESESLLLAYHARLGGELIRIALTRAAPILTRTAWHPALPVTQWVFRKP
jgi:precorrin-6B C5,15-methyltransferase / cobalt-precorrin-6B C5,C15-methyltransferase